MNKNNCYCVIMAGGSGTRFWPVSRAAKPKQFLDIAGTGRTAVDLIINREFLYDRGVRLFDNVNGSALSN